MKTLEFFNSIKISGLSKLSGGVAAIIGSVLKLLHKDEAAKVTLSTVYENDNWNYSWLLA